MSYTPGIRLGTLGEWVEIELRKVAAAINQPVLIKLAELGAEPDKYEDGMIVYADGTSWNPGSGEGFYGRVAGAWVKL